MVKISNNYKQNSQFDYSYEYEYNINGNRTKVTSYDETESIVSEDNYTYSTIYKDRLESVSHNNTSLYTFSYQNDNFLNPSSITRGSNTYSLTWEGRRLVGINYTTYSYNEDGIRILKTTPNDETRYYVSGKKIVRSKYNDDNNHEYIIDYHYDESGTLVGLHYDGKEYFYKKDILGIINEIIDEEGTSFVYYKYTAFGIPTLSINTSLSQASQIVANILLDHNIYIYKDYIYDQDTSLYYLNSRYYDPYIGRFISIDDIEYLDIEIVNGLNLYAYCMNNPVMYSDRDGTFAISIMLIGALIGAAVSFGSSVLSQSVTGDKKINWWQVALDTAIGGISGALGASGINQIGSIIVGGVLGFAGSVGGDLISSNGDWSKVNVKKALLMGAVGALIGKWTGNGTQNTIAMNNAINAGKTWGSKAFLTSAKEAMLHPNSGLVLQNMYNNMAKAIFKYTIIGITKVSVGVFSSTFFNNLVSWE